ncbi:lipase family protein [Paenibacillus sp. GCM10027627]|uniref:lipase family protein n=1 Tax=unclassified Paenibacillus TaxID=185978 RepID=UPI00362ED06C
MGSEPNVNEYIQWGKFVAVAYEMYKQQTLNPAIPADFPTGWKRIANLTMDPASVKWNDIEFAGFIAESLDNPLLQAVVIRGTESPLDWLADFEFSLERFHEYPNAGQTEKGFTDLYRSMKVVYDDGRPTESLMSQVSDLPAGTSLLVTGHSLGSSLATLHAFVAGSQKVAVKLVTFASPRVGDRTFVEAFTNLGIPNARIFNLPDIVPKVPLDIVGYRHIEPGIEINSTLYPIKHSIPCYHALSTYLYVMGDEQVNIDKCKSS